jgi:hypothetical protein
MIQKLQEGDRVVSIAYGDHVVRYAEVQANDLLSLRQRIKAQLKTASVLLKRGIIFCLLVMHLSCFQEVHASNYG